MGFSTDAIHVGQEPDPSTGSIVPPIYQTSTYVQEELGKNKGYDYARTAHPNRRGLERCVAKLEGGRAAFVFSSGMAGIDAVFRLLRPGDHVIVSQAVYGGVFRLATQLLAHFGLEFSFVDTSCLENVAKAIQASTKMIYVETPTNPTMIITDIAGVAKLAAERKLTLVVDNTFLSPYFQQPLALMDCFLVARGIKTLAVRMAQHNTNGMAIARYLEAHPKVKRVLYPGLPSHPQHEIAQRQQRGFGAMLCFDLDGLEAARRLLNSVKLCSLAESLGGVETLISLPALMTHASMPPAVRQIGRA